MGDPFRLYDMLYVNISKIYTYVIAWTCKFYFSFLFVLLTKINNFNSTYLISRSSLLPSEDPINLTVRRRQATKLSLLCIVPLVETFYTVAENRLNDRECDRQKLQFTNRFLQHRTLRSFCLHLTSSLRKFQSASFTLNSSINDSI